MNGASLQAPRRAPLDTGDEDPGIAPALQPTPADVRFDLDRGLAAVVGVRAEIHEDALTAPTLGTEREGNGVLVEDGLVVTIGYLITEAVSVWLLGEGGEVAQADVVAYDQETGFGLLRPLARFPLPTLEIGSADLLAAGDAVLMAGIGGREGALMAEVLTRREFAGYWEYVLDEALFTAPAHPFWGGAGLLTLDGRLAGIGSLYVQHHREQGDPQGGNMCVPIDLLGPILEDLLRYGRRAGPARPWLGMLVQEVAQHLVVSGVYPGCPAALAGIEVGDIVQAVDDEPVEGLSELFRTIWSRGPAGTTVSLLTLRGNTHGTVAVRTMDRNDCLKGPQLH